MLQVTSLIRTLYRTDCGVKCTYAVLSVNLRVLVEDEQFFEIEVNRQDETGNASSEDESDSESSIEAVVVVPKRQKKANTMIGDISKGKYSRS